MTETVIEAQDLTKRYNGVAAVNDVSFSVARGEIFGLLGPNGAGKTTTILMLLGLSEITHGKARVLGHDPVREPLAVRTRYMPAASCWTEVTSGSARSRCSQSPGGLSNCTSITVDPGTLAFKASGVSSATSLP